MIGRDRHQARRRTRAPHPDDAGQVDALALQAVQDLLSLGIVTDRGHQVRDSAIQTPAGLLAVVVEIPEGWMFGHLRVTSREAGFAPPIGAYSDEARYDTRRQATAWFNATGTIPDPHSTIQIDAFGVLVDDAGHPIDVHHVPKAY